MELRIIRSFKRAIRWAGTSREYEEVMELRPGMERLAGQLICAMQHLAAGRPAHGIARAKLEGNPYWSAELAQAAGQLAHERYVVLTPLALSRTQDDKGRVRWTLFGGSEQGPARAFWKGFFTAPGCELAAEVGLSFFRRLLTAAYGQSPDGFHDLKKAGFRILPGLGDAGLALPAGRGVALLDAALPPQRRQARSRSPLPAHLSALRATAQGDSPGLPRRGVAPAAFPRELGILGDAAFLAIAAAASLGHADPALEPLSAARGPAQSASFAVGLDARAASRSSPARHGPVALAEHLPPHAPLGPHPSPRG